MAISYLQVLDKIKTDIWDVYVANAPDDSNLSAVIDAHYDFYSWLCSDASVISTYDTPLVFSSELLKLTQKIIQNELIFNEISADIKAIKTCALDDKLGIITKKAKDSNRDALLRMALKDSNMLDHFNRAHEEEKIVPIVK